ncbi:MAG: hypothetical protein JWL98_1603 [Xanthomonadaceae bacterium]|nr:hypothetical protein [Xanthomonadaceae bacterium]
MKTAGITLLLLAALAGPATAADLRLHALLDGASVVSATESKGTGEATAILTDDNKVRLNLVFGGLASGVTGAAIQLGSSSENGAVAAPLDVRKNVTSGSLLNVQLTLTPDAAASMRDGNTYLLVTTVDHPEGAIRGQLLPQPVRLRPAAPTTP